MIEVLKAFLLFGLIENMIMFTIFKFIFDINIKIKDIIILSLLLILIGFINIPLIKQFIGIILFVSCIYYIHRINIVKIIKIVIFSFMYILIGEAILSLILLYLYSINVLLLSNIQKLPYFIIVEFVQFSLIFLYYKYKRRNNMGFIWFGNIKEETEEKIAEKEEKETEE